MNIKLKLDWLSLVKVSITNNVEVDNMYEAFVHVAIVILSISLFVVIVHDGTFTPHIRNGILL